MLKIIDLGCRKHHGRQLILSGSEAELMQDIVYNLPRDGESHTFICAHGQTHQVNFQVVPEKVVPDYIWEGNILPDGQ